MTFWLNTKLIFSTSKEYRESKDKEIYMLVNGKALWNEEHMASYDKALKDNFFSIETYERFQFKIKRTERKCDMATWVYCGFFVLGKKKKK